MKHLKGVGKKLREGHTYQYLKVRKRRQRALLEAYATGTLCPEYLGVGKKKKRNSKGTQEHKNRN
jgi:hypothetical protein